MWEKQTPSKQQRQSVDVGPTEAHSNVTPALLFHRTNMMSSTNQDANLHSIKEEYLQESKQNQSHQKDSEKKNRCTSVGAQGPDAAQHKPLKKQIKTAVDTVCRQLKIDLTA